MTIKPLITTLLSALLAAIPAASQNLLPKPQTFKANKGSFNINADRLKVLNLVGNDARNIYSAHVLDRHSDQAQHVVLLQHLNNASSPEAYRLHITTDTLSISAASAVAFLRAWQTIAQLSTKHGIRACDIADAPAYQWRSLMIDVSRHFFPISFNTSSTICTCTLPMLLVGALRLNAIHALPTLPLGAPKPHGRNGLPMGIGILTRTLAMHTVAITPKTSCATLLPMLPNGA